MKLRPLAAAVLVGLCGCQDELTAPGGCPALCPGGVPQVFEEVLTPIIGADSSFRGYVQPYNAAALLVTNGLQAQQQSAIMRFPPRADSVTVRDTSRSYVIDSVALSLTVVGRDTNLTGVQLDLYRLPIGIDTATTFADVDSSFSPPNFVVGVPIPDSLNTGIVRTVLLGADLAKLVIPPADTGVLALGVLLNAPVITGVRLGASGSTAPTFVTYATLDVPDTGSAKLRSFALATSFSSFVPPIQQANDSTLLSVGGEPSARSIIRFDFPARLRDSVDLVRATLELTPVAPIEGLPTDPVRLDARAVVADLGGKSPVNSVADTASIPAGTGGTISLEAIRLVRFWTQNPNGPTALMLSVAPALESASFSRPLFYSTRASDPAVRPRLRVNYTLKFPFENP